MDSGCQLLVDDNAKHCESRNTRNTLTWLRDFCCAATIPFTPKSYLFSLGTVQLQVVFLRPVLEVSEFCYTAINCNLHR